MKNCKNGVKIATTGGSDYFIIKVKMGSKNFASIWMQIAHMGLD